MVSTCNHFAKFTNMKFSNRLLALVAFSVTSVVAFLAWTHWQYRPMEKNAVLVTEKPLVSLPRPREADTIFPSRNRVFHMVCDASHIDKSAHSDLNTFDVFHNLDSVYEHSWVEDTNKAVKQISEKFHLPQMDKQKITSEKPLKVIVLPHSHSDPGWLKTIGNYFEDQTKNTLNFMLEKLQKYPDMTFVWAESVFLSMWWKDLDNGQRETVRQLIARNQLEIAVGSWVVPDEANPHYFALIDQMIEGHQWLEHNLGVKPQNTWSLDPFGYTSSLPYLYKRAGFENMVILRVHQFLKLYFQNSQNLDFLWRQHWDRDGTNDIFTTMLPYTLYNIKHQCGPDESVCLKFDFRDILGEYSESIARPVTKDNVESLSKLLLKQYQLKNELFKHNVVLIPIGDDFRYDRSVEWDQQYENYSRLFKYMNENEDLNVDIRFGTLKDYFDEVHKSISENDITVPTLEGDFFPYTDRSEEYWTGYFSSRAYDKSYGKEVEQHLRAAEILSVLAAVSGAQHASNAEALVVARQALALFQHHDAITGTARSYVVIDFEQRLYEALRACQAVIATSAQYLLAKDKSSAGDFLSFEVQQPFSLSMLRPTKTLVDMGRAYTTVVVFNPTARYREDVVRLTLNDDNVEVYDADENTVLSQINPLWMSATEVYKNAFELVFIAVIPPLGISRYRVRAVPRTAKPRENFAAFLSFSNMQNPKLENDMRFKIVPPRSETIMLENDYLRARFSARSGLLQSVTSKAKLSTTRIYTETLMYKSRRSGAYIFEPTGPATDTEMYNTPPIKVIKGPVMSEIQFTQRDSVVTHIVRVYNCTGMLGSALEINNIANMEKFDEHELIMRITTPDIVPPKGVFYSDLNGFQTLKRQRFENFPRQANYYPMASHAYIEDAVHRLSIISAQPLGVSSQEENSLEIMLDRRLLYDDGRGLGEGVRDTKRTSSQFYLLLERKSTAFNDSIRQESESFTHGLNKLPQPSLQAQVLASHLQHRLVVMSQPPAEDATPVSELMLKSVEPLTHALPCDTLLVNLRAISEASDTSRPRRQASQVSAALILHKLGYDCTFPTLGFQCQKDGIVPKYFFTRASIESVREMSLSLMHDRGTVNINDTLKLSPMELYTYKLTFK